MPPKRYEPFKSKVPLEERKKRLQKVLENQPNLIAVILDSCPYSRACFGKSLKLLVNLNYPINYLTRHYLQEKLKLDRNEILVIFHKENFIRWDLKLEEVYQKCKDPEDGYLYLQYSLLECLS